MTKIKLQDSEMKMYQLFELEPKHRPFESVVLMIMAMMLANCVMLVMIVMMKVINFIARMAVW